MTLSIWRRKLVVLPLSYTTPASFGPVRTRSLKTALSVLDSVIAAIAFDAQVLSWSLDNSPPPEFARHYVKEASFYGEDTWSLDLVIKLHEGDENAGKIQVNFVGIRETAMWPGKAKEKDQGGRAMEIFEELDTWLQEHTNDTVPGMHRWESPSYNTI